MAISLAMLGAGDDKLVVNAAWAYVAARITHSFIQSTNNIIPLRFSMFITSSFILLGLTAKAVTLVF